MPTRSDVNNELPKPGEPITLAHDYFSGKTSFIVYSSAGDMYRLDTVKEARAKCAQLQAAGRMDQLELRSFEVAQNPASETSIAAVKRLTKIIKV